MGLWFWSGKVRRPEGKERRKRVKKK